MIVPRAIFCHRHILLPLSIQVPHASPAATKESCPTIPFTRAAALFIPERENILLNLAAYHIVFMKYPAEEDRSPEISKPGSVSRYLRF